MNIRIGKFSMDGHIARADGFDFCVNWEVTNEQYQYTMPKQFFAIWWARGCDTGFFIRGICDLHRKIGRWRNT